MSIIWMGKVEAEMNLNHNSQIMIATESLDLDIFINSCYVS